MREFVRGRSVDGMPRHPRADLPAAGCYHVTNRGVARQAIYRDDVDHRRFAGLLGSTAVRFGWRLLATCHMPNHFHLVVMTELERLSRGMHHLGFRYARGFNDRHDRVGHLFQERFHAALVDGDDYLETVCDYVLDNPLRARLCTSRDEWPWLGGETLRA
jgi:REP element-mobilizing transposase RayT